MKSLLRWGAGLGAAACVAVLIWSFVARPVPVAVPITDLSDMVRVPGGVFSVAGRSFEVESFWIDRFEVTERAWAAYDREAGRLREIEPLYYPEDALRHPDLPVRWVGFAEAEAYAAHRLKRLPSNLEWERASQGPGGSTLPWGEGYVAAANTREAWYGRGFRGWDVTRVGTFERGRSEAGCYDMIGNVWEWTSGGWRDLMRRGPITVSDDLAEVEYRRHRIVRGGSFRTRIRGSGSTLEKLEREKTRTWDIGFRCVVSDAEVLLQRELETALPDLGWEDPLHVIGSVARARRKIAALGGAALPYLERALKRTEHDTVARRLRDLIQTIGRQP